MNKSAIQRFAIQARKDLIDGVSQRAYQYGITKDGYGERDAVTVGGRALTSDEQRQRKELVDQIVSKGYTQVMEEVAYTWFNRFIALRFMEVNNYLPSHIRVFSDSTGAFKPEILNDVLHLDLPGLNMNKVAEYIENNQTEDLYRYLLLTQCNALNESLPRMFERMGGFTELLLPNNILKQDSVLGRMVTEIPEEDWTDQVQIIGWLYQYYNTELKDDTFALLKKNVKISKERIPSATQLFTPDWIVRYMVENSLGRLWIEGHPNDDLKAEWKYYLDEVEQEADVQAQLKEIRSEYANMKPQDIKVIDPCMGSGHILVYAFDVLVQIYKTYGISERDAAKSILENNIYGLDIDDRAAQLAYFAVMMKARQYDRRIFSRGVQPHVYSIVESNGLDGSTVEYFINNDPTLQKNFKLLMEELRDAKEFGSILSVSQLDFSALYARVDEVRDDISIFREIVLNSILPLIQVADVMAQKYDAVITNPPYMGSNNMGAVLSNFVKEHYSNSKADLSTVCMEMCLKRAKKHGFYAMINIPVWMTQSSFGALRREQLIGGTFTNMLHLGRGIFGSDFGTTSFVIRKCNLDSYKAIYRRLFDGLTQVDSLETKEKWFFEGKGTFVAKQITFKQIEGTPIAYWVTNQQVAAFAAPALNTLAEPRQGFATGDNDRFLRFWHEVSMSNIGLGIDSREAGLLRKERWFPCNKGGAFRRWYGNNERVVNWENDGAEMRSFSGSVIRNPGYYFREGMTWTTATMSKLSMRYSPTGFLFESKGSVCFPFNKDNLLYLLGLMNTKIVEKMLLVLAPTVDYHEGPIGRVPVIMEYGKKAEIDRLTEDCIHISQEDWDAYEASWDFKEHPLVRISRDLWDATAVGAAMSYYYGCHPKVSCPLELCFMLWQGECNERFKKLKENEEELNRIFIDIYGLQDELTPEVDDKDVTVRKADLNREIRSFISYAVGCMFGRYSLDTEGLAYAGGEWDVTKYKTVIPDRDNIIPICDDDYFDDDITGRFVKFVEVVFGKEKLEENLKYIADALGGKGTSREVIREYFLSDKGFYADHLKIYQKRPIYWLFDSGKKNGFKALIYMHRYQSDLLARMRTDYVHEQQERYRTQLSHLQEAVDRASASEKVKLNKQIKKIQEQALEIQKYEEKIHHLADQNISIDLDDGVKHNYALFADVLAKIK